MLRRTLPPEPSIHPFDVLKAPPISFFYPGNTMDALLLLGTWICPSLAALLLLFQIFHSSSARSKKNFPPGPFSWPLVGSLFSLGPYRHRSLAEMARKYGPVMFLRLGVRPHIIISSPEMARQVLKEHDVEFASRPLFSTIGRLLSYNFQDLIFAPHGERWKMLRRVCGTELFTASKVSHFAGTRKRELGAFGEIVEASAKDGHEFDLSSMLHEYFTNLMTCVLFGRKFYGTDTPLTPEAEAYKASWAIQAKESRRLFAGDYIPAIRWLDTLRGTQNRLKNEALPARSRFLEAVIEEHAKDFDPENPRDFVDVMLTLGGENKLSNDQIIALLQDLLLAGTGTSKGTIEWAISELIVNPRVQEKAHEELDRVVGRDRPLEESHLKDLLYIQAIVKEVFRKRPIAPLGLPHYNDREVTLAGYTIAAHTTVLVNIWAIHHDPSIWSDPELFLPERFLGSDHSVLGKDFDLLPFSSGRRRCVGIPLAMPHVTLTLAYLLHRWSWRSPLGKPIEMAELAGAGAAAVTSPRIVCASHR
ncbi:cytochrome P450 71A1-like [Selaginella moellendorffii]|uniref:cytochrome P450 71A1-like n=1 Tax=Selaginella moellendorffii TaxID=88036 RepID=UPI000D1CF2A0|nr:cytochrome P450 71A1-like [Selaginella moellendorffii]|eukprot:XP_024515148.1 cytochrome P450 71A1-like [Selaginella moellendorffii]